MDAQELPEALIAQSSDPRVETSECPCIAQRLPALCSADCSLHVLDLLLSMSGAVDGQETDLLLDLRSLFRKREEAEASLRLFCELRRRMEHRHYVAFYRLRRWCERHIVAEIGLEGRPQGLRVPVRMDFYCVEAIRRACLCGALARTPGLSKARLTFSYSRLDSAG